MEEIKFANGKVYSCTLLATYDPQNMVYIAIDGVSFGEAAEIFSNPEYTRKMEYGGYILEGYTELSYVLKESFGIKACLTGGRYVRKT